MEAHVARGSQPARHRLPLRLTQLADEPLARLAGAGNSMAFAALYRRYSEPLYRYCRSILHSDVNAQDALQSAFAGSLAALKRGQRDAPVRPWLFRIAHNEAVSLLRRRRPDAEASRKRTSLRLRRRRIGQPHASNWGCWWPTSANYRIASAARCSCAS